MPPLFKTLFTSDTPWSKIALRLPPCAEFIFCPCLIQPYFGPQNGRGNNSTLWVRWLNYDSQNGRKDPAFPNRFFCAHTHQAELFNQEPKSVDNQTRFDLSNPPGFDAAILAEAIFELKKSIKNFAFGNGPTNCTSGLPIPVACLAWPPASPASTVGRPLGLIFWGQEKNTLCK